MSKMMSQLIFATKKLLIVALIVIADGVAGHAQENLPEGTQNPGDGDGSQLALYEPVSYTHLTLPTIE